MTTKNRSTLRALWVQVHLWLGLTLGVIGALLGLSGSILVYDDVVDAWLNPARYAVSGTQVALPLAEYAQRAEQAAGSGARAGNLRLPDLEGGPVVAFVRARGDTGGFRRVYLDPPTGRVLDAGTGNNFVGWLHNFHESLTLREFYGREIVGTVGIAMLISSLSGIYLWWPAGGVRRSALGFRRGFALHRNLHYTFGIWGVVVLAMLSFTGIFLGFPDAGRAVVAAFSATSPSPRGIQSAEGAGRGIAPDDAAAIALQRYPDATVIGLGLPTGPRGAYRVNLREAGDTTSRSGTVVFIDARSQAILYKADRSTRPAGDTFLLWQRILHEGGAFGEIGRFVVFLGGLLPPLFVVTGLHHVDTHAQAARRRVGIANRSGVEGLGSRLRALLAGEHALQPHDERVAPCLGQIDHALEIRQSAVIRIGHLARTRPGRHVQEEPQVPLESAWPQFGQHAQIRLVHGEDPLESSEVLGHHLACAQARDVIAAVARRGDCAMIGGSPTW